MCSVYVEDSSGIIGFQHSPENILNALSACLFDLAGLLLNPPHYLDIIHNDYKASIFEFLSLIYSFFPQNENWHKELNN